MSTLINSIVRPIEDRDFMAPEFHPYERFYRALQLNNDLVDHKRTT